MTEEQRPKGISRRTIAKGAAWAIPVVPLVVAAPAYAQSVCLEAKFGPSSCKGPGKGNVWSYKFEICFYNSCGAPLTLYLDHLQNNSGSRFTPCPGEPPLPTSITIPGGGTPTNPTHICIDPIWFSSTNSAGTVEVWGSYSPITLSNPAVKLVAVKTTGSADGALGICGIDDGTNPCPQPAP